MDKLQKYQPTGLSRLERIKEAMRAYWMGPITSSDPRAREFFGGPPTSTGVAVDEFSALNYSAVFAAVGLISSQVGNLPLVLYRKVGEGGKERFDRHPLYRLIHDRPNPDMSSFVFRETLQAHILTWGNGYAEIQRDGAGRPAAFWPITPDRVTPFRRSADAPLEYRIVNRDGGDVFIPQGDMLHYRGMDSMASAAIP
jgi:HK97 family phage portal protein